MTSREVRVHGAGFTALRIERAWLGKTWIPDLELVDDARLRLQVPAYLPAGRHELVLRTGEGCCRTGVHLEVLSPTLEAEVVEEVLRVRCDVPGTARVALWLSPLRSEFPVATRFGEFGLATALPGRPKEAPDAPFLFARNPANVSLQAVYADGCWIWRVPLVGILASSTEPLFGQVLAIDSSDPTVGALSRVAVVENR